jgi:acyl dehydratase
MREFATLAELAAEQGNEIGVSSWTDITQERINQFAEVTGDHQWIHTDPERTQRELQMTPIAHGYLTLSLLPAFMSEIFSVTSLKRMINFGANNVRFVSMVPVGSRLRGRVGLQKGVLSSSSLRTICDVKIEIEGQTKPALKAEVITLMYE